MEIVKSIANKYTSKELNVGLRCNFDINDGAISRFGYDVEGEEFEKIINTINTTSNLHLIGLHCHFANRYLETWPNRVTGILELFISVGGGLFGKMDITLKKQFEKEIPNYQDYAEVIATKFKEAFQNLDGTKQPKLIIEPGSALVGDVMKFVTRIINIKDIRGKKIATVAGSIYNVNPTLNQKNPPVTIYHNEYNKEHRRNFVNIDFGGYTCIETDYLYKGYN
ncbi:hypothetical protein RhiirA1_483326, partial [Rhizophagus irregularis]